MTLFVGKPDQLTIKRVAVLVGDMEKEIKVEFTATYRIPGVKENKQVWKDITAGVISDEQVMETYLVNWSLAGTDGNPIAFTPENVAAAMDIKGYRSTLLEGFQILTLGRDSLEAAKQKN